VAGIALPRFACLAALVVVGGLPSPAAAQPADAATQVGAIAEQIVSRTVTPWRLEGGFQIAADRGNADFDSHGGNVLYLHDTGTWRFGATAGATRARGFGFTLSERSSADFAAERAIKPNWHLILTGDWFRSPPDGINHRNAGGGVVAWVRQRPKWAASLFGGMYAVNERYTGVTEPDETFPESLVGAKFAFTPTASNSLGFLVTHAQDLSESTNYRIGAMAVANAQLVKALGLRMSYTYGFDHKPAHGREDATHSVSAGITVTLGPTPPAPAKP
jgi:hypothetical protein